jgi:hypothetical protein
MFSCSIGKNEHGGPAADGQKTNDPLSETAFKGNMKEYFRLFKNSDKKLFDIDKVMDKVNR